MSRRQGLIRSLKSRFTTHARAKSRPGYRPSGRCWTVERLDERLVLSAAAWADAPAAEPASEPESVLVAPLAPNVCQGLVTDPLGVQPGAAITGGPGDDTVVRQPGTAINGDGGADEVAQPIVLRGLDSDPLSLHGADVDSHQLMGTFPEPDEDVASQLDGGADDDQVFGGSDRGRMRLTDSNGGPQPVLQGLSTDTLDAQAVDEICGGNGNDSVTPPVLRGIVSDPLGAQTEAAVLGITGDGGDDTFTGRPVLQGLFSDTLGLANDGGTHGHEGSGFMADTADE